MLRRFLGLHPGENKNLILFSILGFCWSIASSSGISLSDAFFLEYVGTESLAMTFTYTSIGMFCMSGIFIYLYNRFDINQIFFTSLSVGALFYAGIFSFILLGVTSPLLWIIFKIFTYILQIAYISHFFTFLDQFFELQNAKKVFSILYCPIFLGMSVSGAILSLSFSKLGLLGILILILLSLGASLLLLRYISQKVTKMPDDHQEFAITKTSKRAIFKAIITSPFTLLFVSGSIVLQTLLVLTEYEYMSGLELAFAHSDPSQLTRFLGNLYFWGSLINIVFGLCFYGRIVKKMGLNNVIMIVPIFFTTLFTGWMFSSHLFLPVMGFIAVEGLLALLEDNNFNLLLNAVPLKLKNKIRITCESLLEPMGMLVSSLLLLLFQSQSKVLGLSFSILFLVLTGLMRAYYTKGIFYNLISHLIPFPKNKIDLKSKVSKREYRQSRSLFYSKFFDMKEGEQLFILESALRFHDQKFIEQLLKKITKLSCSIKRAVFELFEHYPSAVTVKYMPYFQFWIQQSPSLEEDFFFFLSKMKLLEVKVAQKHLSHPHPKVRGASLLTLRQKIPHSFESKQARRLLYQLLISLNEEDNLIAIQILKYERLIDFKSKVFELLSTSSFTLKEEILKTLPHLLDSQDKQYAPILLKMLQEESFKTLRPLLLEVIGVVADVFLIKELLIRSYHFTLSEKKMLQNVVVKMGQSALPELESIVQNSHLPDPIRLMAAQILGQISHRSLRFIFNKIWPEEIERAYFYLYHLTTLPKTMPHLNMGLIEIALRNSYDSVFQFLIECLALLNRFEQGDHLVKSLQSDLPKTYSHALETLEKLCSSKHYKKLKPILEHEKEASFVKLYHKLNLPVLTLDNLLDRLEQTPSYTNQTLVSLFRDRFNIPGSLEKSIVQQLSKNLDHFTQELLEVL